MLWITLDLFTALLFSELAFSLVTTMCTFFQKTYAHPYDINLLLTAFYPASKAGTAVEIPDIQMSLECHCPPH
jgi:hypothetical protein